MSFHHNDVAANSAITNDFENELDSITKEYDAVVFDVLRVNAEDIANQLTLIDLPLFKAIEAEELSSCAWNTKRKFDITPNVVHFTRRFNHVSFWVTREILNANTAKQRADIISHFVKMSKRLLEVRNIHSLKAVISGLQSAPIYRLIRTWSLVSKKDKEKVDRLNELVSEEDNRSKLRAFLEVAKLPCIPYLGMYLTDLTYINTIHPSTGGLDIQRGSKMNAILRVIADFQQSNYDFITPLAHVQKYLMSVKYIEELQKFMEDDNYKLSLKIEPNAIAKDRGSVREEGRASPDAASLAGDLSHQSSSVFPSTRTHLQIPVQAGSLGRSFKPSHRKSRSLGNSVMMSTSLTSSSGRSFPCRIPSDPLQSRNSVRHLLDDSLIHESNLESQSCSSFDSGLDHEEQESHPIIQSFDHGSRDELTPHIPDAFFQLQGFLKRKTYLKDGQRPRVSHWNRYWIGLTGSCLVYFLPKYRGFGGQQRENFRIDPHKVMSLYGWSVLHCKTTTQPDLFQLVDEKGVNVYRFIAGSPSNSAIWCKLIADAIDKSQKQNPANLISFGESDDDNSEDTKL